MQPSRSGPTSQPGAGPGSQPSLVFIDETGASTKMARLRGRALKLKLPRFRGVLMGLV